MDATAAILIGGRARRLSGTFKSALRVGTRTILQRQLDALAAAGIERVLLVGRPSVGVTHDLPLTGDAIADSGPLGGIYSALLAATTPVVVVLAGDLPFVQPGLLERLVALAPTDDAAVPKTDRWHPLCAAYRRRVALRLKSRLDRGALRAADALMDMQLRTLNTAELAGIDPTGMMLTNVNTPDDYARAERHARAAR